MRVVLFARCSNCQTVFQVTAAQLEAARGFVRCGRCQTAFNALDSLQDEQGRPVSRPKEDNDASASGFIHIASDQPSLEESSRSSDDRPQPTMVKVIGGLNHLDTVATFSTSSDTPQKKKPHAPTATTKAETKVVIEVVSETPATKSTPPPVEQTAPTVPEPEETAPESEEIEIPTLFLAATMEDLSRLRYPVHEKTFRPLARLDLLLGWLAACTVMLIIFSGQLAFITRDRAVNYLPLRFGLEAACDIFDCTLPPRRSLTEFAILERNVAIHPNNPDALIAEMIFANQASFDQPLPLIEFSLLDPSSEPVAWRQFTPDEYLSETPPDSAWIKPNEPVLMKIEITNPGGEMENYRFRFF